MNTITASSLRAAAPAPPEGCATTREIVVGAGEPCGGVISDATPNAAAAATSAATSANVVDEAGSLFASAASPSAVVAKRLPGPPKVRGVPGSMACTSACVGLWRTNHAGQERRVKKLVSSLCLPDAVPGARGAGQRAWSVCAWR